ncbi:sensor histidine kinase [Pseudonocardia eucalypti]|uniref:Sensor histidine kinase n=1 Tax=Pseudonocardia eucalypti TaxID=648755 RepID=A0ABP9QNA5_9PSEU|nr:two-component system sensor histidine kinase DesK [Pseudonocardia eucalypti]
MNSVPATVDPDDDVLVDDAAWPAYLGSTPSARRGDRLGASLFVLFLVPIGLASARDGMPPGPLAVLVALLVLYALCFLGVWWVPALWRGTARRLAMICVVFPVGVAVVLLSGLSGSMAVLGYALSASNVMLPLRWARVVGLVTVFAALPASWLVTGAVDWVSVVFLAMVAMIALGMARLARLVGALRAARSEIRALAVAGERERMARDLHDVLGHSLTTITVKTALARRLVESGADGERVAGELRETEDLSRRALADIRATVSGQRRMSLVAELVSARAALRAAGIEADLPHAVDDVEARAEEPLAYVLREGVTNVVRHSGAGRCTVRVGARWLEVVDDGAGPPGEPGNGLTGLAERLAEVRGTLDFGPLPTGGFRLSARVPG